MADYDDRLDGWKEIARFIGRTVRTARRRGKAGMPIYKLPTGGVFAYKSEIRAWERKHRAEMSSF